MKKTDIRILTLLPLIGALLMAGPGCKNTGPTAVPTPMPSVYVYDDMESGVNDWIDVMMADGTTAAGPVISSPGSNASAYCIAISYTVKSAGTSAPFKQTAFTFKLMPTKCLPCGGNVCAMYSGPDLTGYTSLKFDAKYTVVTPPSAGSLSFNIKMQAAATSCSGSGNKFASAAFSPGSSWAETVIPLDTFVPYGAFTLADIEKDVILLEFHMDIDSSQVDDLAEGVLCLDNIRFE
jgi:hypothetical protein